MKKLLCHRHIFGELFSFSGVLAKILKSASHTCARARTHTETHTHTRLRVEILIGIALNLRTKLQ